MRKISILLMGVMGVCLSHVAQAQDGFVKSIVQQELVDTGKQVFESRCSGCHGLTGDGNGPGAPMLNPKPRNLQSGIFKFKSGPVGTMPSDADLMKTLNQGVIGTSMPSFRLMSDTRKLALIQYIKTLAPEAWKNANAESAVAPLQLPSGMFTQKAAFLKSAAEGRVWFQEMGCVACHGNSGRGDGPSAKTLKDAWGADILPANLHKPYIKRGLTVQDVAASISFGVDGTPMPGYLDAVPDKSVVWNLAAYVFYLRGFEAGLYPDEPIKPIPDSKIPQNEVDAVIGKYTGAVQ